MEDIMSATDLFVMLIGDMGCLIIIKYNFLVREREYYFDYVPSPLPCYLDYQESIANQSRRSMLNSKDVDVARWSQNQPIQPINGIEC